MGQNNNGALRRTAPMHLQGSLFQ